MIKIRKIWIVLALIICSLFVTLGEAAKASDEENVTIFIYHKFGESQYPTTNVGIEKFAEQMQYLSDNKYQVISLNNMADLLEKGEPLPDKTAVITIDDGYRSIYNNAWPILKKFNYPFTVFLYVKAVDRRYRNFLTWQQIDEMSQAGVDFQDHTYSHHRFGTPPKGSDEKKWRQWVRDDLTKGRSILAKHLGYKPQFLALPYGEYNTLILEEARKVGYRLVFSQDPGSVSSSTDYIVPREPILGNDWSTLKHFRTVLKRVDLPFLNINPSTQPFKDNVPSQFCVTLANAENYKSGTLGIYVSELGWQAAQLNGRDLCINNSTVLTRRTNRVAVSGRLKKSGLSAIGYWLLINPDVPIVSDP